MSSKKRKILGIMLVVGILLVFIGLICFDHEQEVATYHKIFKDFTGTWQGGDVYYLTDKTGVLETIGVVLAIVGGVGLYLDSKDQNHKQK